MDCLPDHTGMKILHVIDSGGLYGAEVMLLNLMTAQKQLGLDPILLSISAPGIHKKEIEIKAIELGLPCIPIEMKPGLNIKGARKLFRLAEMERTSIIHSHGYKGNILLGLLPLWWRRRPVVTTLHGWTWTGKLSRMMVYEWLDAVSLRFVDRVVLVNPGMVTHPRLKHLTEQHRAVIPNGVDHENIDSLAAVPIPEEIRNFIQRRFTIVAAGRFSREKNFASLLHLVARMVAEGQDVQLLLLGDGGQRENLVDLQQRLDIVNRVMMPGYVKNVAAFLKHCQLFAMPSLTEGLPMALLEAMAAGIPVIASRVGGIPEVLDQGRAGLLIEPGDDLSLFEATLNVFNDRNAAQKRSHLARKKLESQYSSRRMARDYLDVYRQVIRG